MVRVAKGRSACKRQPIAPDGATPAAIGAVRLIVGGLTLVIWVFARGSFRDCFSLPIRPTLVAAASLALPLRLIHSLTKKVSPSVGVLMETMGAGCGTENEPAEIAAWQPVNINPV